jgi:DNA-binding PadR family transcriptional regulator
MCVGRIFVERIVESVPTPSWDLPVEPEAVNRPAEPDPAELLPLTPVAFDILLSLLDGDAHGYAIMRSVQERTGGQTSLHAGTLYRALSRLVDAGMIEERDSPPKGASDERRRYYRVTRRGRRVASAEARRLESQLGAARAHGLLGSA